MSVQTSSSALHVTYAVPTVILGDVNVYLDDPDAPCTAGVNTTLAGFDLVQLVTGRLTIEVTTWTFV